MTSNNCPCDTCEWDRLSRDDRQQRYATSPRCVCCGSSFATDPGDQAEVVTRSTGSRGVAHAECYLAETDTYELA
jgi:hypothetical protein